MMVLLEKLLEEKFLFEMFILLSLFEFIDFDLWFCCLFVKLISFLLFSLGDNVIGDVVDEDFCFEFGLMYVDGGWFLW